MRQKLWFGFIFLALLGSQFGIAVGVSEWLNSETAVEIVEVAKPQTTPRPLTKCESMGGELASAQTEYAAKVIALEMQKLNCIASVPFDLRRIEFNR